METAQDVYNDVISQIVSAKKHNKNSIKLKTFQCDYKNGKPVVTFSKVGLYENEFGVGEGVLLLRKDGYNVCFTSTDKSTTEKVIKGSSVTKTKKLRTVNMIVSWT